MQHSAPIGATPARAPRLKHRHVLVALAAVAVAALGAVLVAAGSAAPLDVQTASITERELTPSPIPASWVLEGRPQARIKHLAAAHDGGLSAALWDCTEGKFKWFFEGGEFVHILEGQVTIENEDGSGRRVLGPGDVAYFPAGSESIWTVNGYVKKLALFRDNKVGLAGRVARRVRRALASRF